MYYESKNMNKNSVIIVAILVFVLGAFLYVGIQASKDMAYEAANICVLDRPYYIVSGRISSYGYYLSYQGKRKLTGDVCEEERRVTKKEYERRMYERYDD